MFELSCHLYKLPMINNPLYVWIFVKVYRTQMVCTGLHKNVDLIIEKKKPKESNSFMKMKYYSHF